MRFLCCYVVVLFLSVQAATAADPARGRPMLYSYVAAGGAEGERLLKEAYGARYTIVPARNASGLISPKLTSQTYPPYGRVPGGNGKVVVAFIAAPNGHVKDPVILHSTNPRVNRMVREMVGKRLCKPTQLNGAPMATIVSQNMGFSRMR